MKQAHDNPEIADSHLTESSGQAPLAPIIPVRVMDAVERACFATDLTSGLQERYSSVQTYVLLKNAEDVIEQALLICKDKATGQAEKDSKVFNAEITTRRSVEYGYEDSVLERLESEIVVLKKKADERRKMLRALTSEVADTVTGEILRPAKLTKDGLAIIVKLPK